MRRELRGAVLALALTVATLAVPSTPAMAADAPLRLTHEQLEAKYADKDSRFALIDDVRLHYKDQGQGPAILLIHGSMGDLWDWDGWVRVLALHHRVVRLDLPGFGISGAIGNGNYSIDRSLSLIDGLMDELGIERFALAGVSYGGPIAFRYAATRTGRVTGLVIMNSAGIEYGKQAVDPKTGEKSYYKATTTGAVTREFIAKGLRASFSNPELVSEAMLDRKYDVMNAEGRAEEAAIMIRQYVRGDPLRVLAHVRAPVLVLWGGAEKALSQETGDAFASAVKNSRAVRKVVQPGGGHTMHVDLAEPTARTVEAFLTDLVKDERTE